MMCEVSLRIRSKDADSTAKALSVDNAGGCVESRAEGDYVVTDVRSESLGGILSYVDDVIRCQIVSEAMV
jgi:hypothetical protein